MTHPVKFTPFGIPYITEFDNVAVVPERPPRSPASSTSSFCHVERPPPQPRFPSFSLPFFRRKPAPPTPDPPRCPPDAKPLPPSPQPDPPPGIYIQLPPGHTRPRMTRRERLVHLQQTISAAVLDAGMSGSPGNSVHPERDSNENPPHRSRGHKTPDALFCGTYGQLMTALENAGLSAAPCVDEGEGVSGYTRLGALFVARNDGASGVQLRKITLWG